MLISVRGLKRDYWETYFELNADRMENAATGAVIAVQTGDKGLPVVDLKFGSETEWGLVCTPCEEDQEAAPTIAAIRKEVKQEQKEKEATRKALKNTKKLALLSLPKRMTKTVIKTSGARRNINNKQKQEEKQRHRELQGVSKMVEHWRMCHFSEAGARGVTCHDCLECKGGRTANKTERSEQYRTPAPFLLFATDFFGKVKPVSYRGNQWGMLFVCDHCGYIHGKPLAQAPEALEGFVNEVRSKCGCKQGENKTHSSNMIFWGSEAITSRC